MGFGGSARTMQKQTFRCRCVTFDVKVQALERGRWQKSPIWGHRACQGLVDAAHY